jgi:Protein of unknown function (DUF3641)
MSTVLPVIQPAAAFASSIDFDEKLAAHGLELRASSVDTLQINLGKLCNQTCKHCHVDSGPSRTEMMSRETADQVSVDWTGRLYNCDFNQMLELGLAPELPQTIAAFDPEKLARRRIMTGSHCFGCTAGAGSSCGGAVTTSVSRST